MDILHCDLDAFFASVEQRDRPELKGKPVVVGAMPGTRGVVSTCSYEARKFGIHSAMPINKAYRLCPTAVFLLPDMQRYKEASRQVFDILGRFTPVTEPLSIDEAFLDVRGCHKLFGSSMDIARQIKDSVRKEAGLNISIGIAENKFLAKLASDLCKPDGIMEIGQEYIKRNLPQLPVTSLWGVGKKTAQRLNKAGIYTVDDLANTPGNKLSQIVGFNAGTLLDLSKGKDPRPVSPKTSAKSLGNEVTFPQDIDDPEVIKQVILELSYKVGFGLRQSHMLAYTISLKLRTADFQTFNRSKSLDTAVDSDLVIGELALDLYEKSGLTQEKLRLVGVTCSKLIPFSLAQPGLFDSPDQGLDNLIDDLKNRFSEIKIGRGNMFRDFSNN